MPIVVFTTKRPVVCSALPGCSWKISLMTVWMLSRFVKKLLTPVRTNPGKMNRYTLTAGFST